MLISRSADKIRMDGLKLDLSRHWYIYQTGIDVPEFNIWHNDSLSDEWMLHGDQRTGARAMFRIK